jgi:hypothetical protein
MAKKKTGTIQDEQIVNERCGSKGKKKVIGGFRNRCTPRIRMAPRLAPISRRAFDDRLYPKIIAKNELFRCPALGLDGTSSKIVFE